MNTCPYCGHAAMTLAAKSCVGPLKHVPCAACGRQVSMSWLTLLALVPFLAGIVAATSLFATRLPLALGVLLAGFGVMCLLHAKAVPIVGREGRGFLRAGKQG